MNKLLGFLIFCQNFLYRIHKKYQMACIFYDWKKINRHNRTVPANPVWQELFPINKVKVGKHTYGDLHVVPYNKNDGHLIIGSYCSIARNVKFLLGGNHVYSKFSTYPFQTIIGWSCSSFSKGDIVIGDDVWIGENSLILSGVKIGQGAIIAANSLVSKDVKPYEIVGGTPIRHIKFRFSDSIIAKLLSINFNDIDEKFLASHETLFNIDLDERNIDVFIGNMSDAVLN